jgi:hypothetical protein
MKRLLLCSIAALLSLSGCKSNDSVGLNKGPAAKTRETITSTISDPARVTSMLAVMDAYQSDTAMTTATIKKIRQQIVDASADYSTTRKALEKLYSQLNTQVTALGNTFRDRNFELRKLCSADEWRSIAAGNKALVEFRF